eukprot:COSAG02_NODE_58_length_43613_cov_235.901572_21_plen_48_part_00
MNALPAHVDCWSIGEFDDPESIVACGDLATLTKMFSGNDFDGLTSQH